MPSKKVRLRLHTYATECRGHCRSPRSGEVVRRAASAGRRSRQRQVRLLAEWGGEMSFAADARLVEWNDARGGGSSPSARVFARSAPFSARPPPPPFFFFRVASSSGTAHVFFSTASRSRRSCMFRLFVILARVGWMLLIATAKPPCAKFSHRGCHPLPTRIINCGPLRRSIE